MGLNCILGFNKSFNGFFCRFCTADKQLTKELCSERSDLLRNPANYATNASHKDNGVAELCVFNRIPSFHVVDNLAVDVMHDIMEGICHYDLCCAITYFTEKMKFFSLDALNRRLKTFEYGEQYCKNIPPQISCSHLKKMRLKFSAAEMQTFVVNFPIMIGDLVPHEDEVWQFVLLLKEIVDNILTFEVNDSYICFLKSKIA